MHTIDIPGKGESYIMASEMHELNTAQYLTFCNVMQLLERGKISMEDAELSLAISFAEIKFGWRYAFMSKKHRLNVHLNLLQLTPLAKTVFEEKTTKTGEKVLVPSILFVDNKIKRFKGLNGPDDALQNCSFYEYKEANAAWLQYQDTQDPVYLDELIAILYRPAIPMLWFRRRQRNFSGDSRIPYTAKSNPVLLKKRINKVHRWPNHVKYGIWLWFTACMEFLRTGKPVIDGNEIDLSILYKGGEGSSPGIGLTGVLFSLAETHVFGTIEETGNANLYDVLSRLYQLKLQMDELKQKSKSND